MTLSDLIQAAGGRKFTIAVGIEVVASVALFLRVIDQSTWMQVSVWVLGLFAGSNVGQKIGLTMKGPATPGSAS